MIRVLVEEKDLVLRKIEIEVETRKEFVKALKFLINSSTLFQPFDKRIIHKIADVFFFSAINEFITIHKSKNHSLKLFKYDDVKTNTIKYNIILLFFYDTVEYDPYHILKQLRKLKATIDIRVHFAAHYAIDKYSGKTKNWCTLLAKKIMKYGIIPSEVVLANLINNKFEIDVRHFALCYSDNLTIENLAIGLSMSKIKRKQLYDFVDFIIKENVRCAP